MAEGRRRSNRETRRDRFGFYVAYVALLCLAVFVLQLMRIFGPPFGAGIFLLILVGGIAVTRPALGLGIAIPLAIVGDGRMMSWWPTVKNLSSRESVLYVADGFSLSPFELVLVAVVVVWFVGRLLRRDMPGIIWGPFWRPLALFTLTVLIGLAWGLGKGGDARVALFEARPLLYLPIVYIAASNLFTTARHYHRLLWGIVVAISVESLHGVLRLVSVSESLPDGESPIEHTAALHMNVVLVLLIATLWFGTTVIGKRLLLSLMLIPVLMLYLEAERHAAIVALVIGLAFLAIVLFARDRRQFMRIIPLMAVIGLAYVGAFWNAEDSQVGFPAQAIRIIVQPDAATEKDAASDLYREIEKHDLTQTIRSNPLLGVGFGAKFSQPVPLPDISFFEFWEYIPHNSLLWIWLKTGFVGFATLVYIFGLATATGVRTSRRARDGDDASMVASFSSYVPMVMVFAFVDITFDAQTMILLAAALALVGSAERIIDQDPTSPADINEPTKRGREKSALVGSASGASP